MRNAAKLTVIFVFALGALFIFLSSNGSSTTDAAGFSEVAMPTPPKNTNSSGSNGNLKPAAVNATANVAKTATPANTVANTSTTPASGGKTITKSFTLGQNSLSEYGEAPFDHENHAFKNYSPDGKSVVGCVECHHTDQPKSAMTPPYVTSERDEILTMAVYQKSSQKVSGCRGCHFQDGNVPDGKTMPTANNKDLDNKLAYHINCNTCHDAAYKARSDLKAKNKTFATSKDCAVCHKVE